ncbi:MAG: hypothetical protein ACW99G_02635 [Candidatus Thorarchaeota archaeon]|jgi:hypothetical protein
MYEVRSGSLHVKIYSAKSMRDAATQGMSKFDGNLNDVIEVTKDGNTKLFSVKSLLHDVTLNNLKIHEEDSNNGV